MSNINPLKSIPTQTLKIEGCLIEIQIKSFFKHTKFKEAELILMASQMLKAYSLTTLKESFNKLEVV